MNIRLLAGTAAIALLTACTTMDNTAMDLPGTAANNLPDVPQGTGIFAQPSTLPFHAPDFDAIQDTDYQPAIEQGIAIQLVEIERIANNPAPATFSNTIVETERTGQMLSRAYNPFSQEVGANTNDVLDAADSALSPQLAAMNDAIYLNPVLFARVKAVYDNRAAMTMTPEDAMLLETTYAEFVHNGALLDEAAQQELRQINTRISELETEFSQKLTAATSANAVVVDTREELAGLTEGQIATAASAAADRGVPGKFVLTLQNTTQQPLLTSLDNRDVRERLYKASINRTSSGGENDTTGIIREIVELRTRKAELFDTPDYATWQMYDRFAATPSRALDFMRQMVPALSATQEREAEVLNERIAQDGHNFTVQPWDWPYYAEKVRQERYSLDENAIKQYFVVDRVLEDGVFYMANKLYGLTFEKRDDIPVYHPDVTVYTVFDADGSELALFYFDPFQRDNKQGGAWMSNFVEQSHLLGDLPVVTNTQNIAPPAEGQPALASWDDVNTMFHEFGHALHGMFANQMYPSLSGTATARDWVEFPSQFHENFATVPEVLSNYAKHWETGETIPAELLSAIDRASKFDQGYALGETLTAALLDMEWHALAPGEAPADVMGFEAAALDRLGLKTDLVPPRYRTPYFRHIFSHGYDAGYYSYLWTEMLHHDAYSWVEANGGMTREVGDHIRATFLGQGHSKSYDVMYRDFTGREPRVEPMLEARGLLESE
ncbi:M3 family metallopeptidase [Alteraurantiacibacter aquimixticola]|uniref:M3 family peptidase n=1 Tax=Alteraurantiacibacter aquimixticola TaxID=2489173 RepID=A0A4T3F6B2_9SPHN|nr:M3 family metallopeptidase [Alteraurantiacibacter aquimixticola]TIX50396.1 M3 family peptidase [Alteraurantiacibacter aquimixticola]